ncbi:MAG TPA: PH domain-containing protein, partial [Mycobacteriales bacterium]|nr:PH domain-containing protein [Mycobacteriales bacterium]
MREDEAPTVRIRPSRTMLPAVLIFAFCVLPLAGASRWLLVLFVLPVLALAWVLRVGVDVGPAAVTIRALLGRRRIPWSEVAGLRAGDRGDLWLVLSSGRRLRLPTARARHLPVIAAASGGRVPDPNRAAPDGPPAPRPGDGSGATDGAQPPSEPAP